MSSPETASVDGTQPNETQSTIMETGSVSSHNDHNQDGAGRLLLESGSSEDDNIGEWRTIQRRKRLRTSTGSSSTASSLSMADFEKLSMDGKMSALFGELGGLNKKVDKCVSVHPKVEAMEAQLGDHSSRITQLEYRSLDLEARSRRNNLIFTGIPESRNENCAETIADFLKSNLNIDPCPPIPRVHRLGRYNRSKIRPIIAYFLDTRDTETVISKASMLRGSKFSINRDFPKEISNARKELWPRFKELRRKYPDSKVAMTFPAKIIVDGEVIADKFPKWNLYLHGNKQSSGLNHESAHRGKHQAAREKDPQRSTMTNVACPGDIQSNQPKRNMAPMLNRSSRRRSKSPGQSNLSRGHAPSRDRQTGWRQHQRTSSLDSTIIRPWATRTDEEVGAESAHSQSILQGH